MLSRLFGPRSAAPDCPDSIVLDDPPVTVRLRVNARARRFTLRLTPDGQGAVLTLPPDVPPEAARHFVESHAGWLAGALARQPSTVTMAAGTTLPVDGRQVTLRLEPGGPRAPRLGPDTLTLRAGTAAGPRVAAFLKVRARERMAPAIERYAAEAGRRCTALSFRDTRSRWGSCSSAGRISLSWRLAMAPPVVQDYVAAHEVAHLVEMNHSPRYWAVLARLMPDYEIHRRWLRREGRALHAYDFSA